MPAGQYRVKGTADERAQAREQLRAELLAAARAAAAEGGGFENVTMRAVADRVGYTAPIVYQSFANKRALLLGVVDVGFAELADRLDAARGAVDAEAGMLPAVAAAYWEFAAADPHLYRLMHNLPDVPFGTPDAPPSAIRCFEVLKDTVRTAAPGHPATAYDDDAAADLLWAHLHGLVSLTLEGRIKGGPARGRDLLTELTAAFASARATP
ncbi:TetR/AcrR family transcriptional regulator [Yinghuangia soli]|uniref:TetR/AcrR family transcriptional regulator n=1 Tax=Yinghuangia soli TaxID=2908204 RepID=A0AA41U0Z2_9ACTN|nr:TetR/AcrR family transcriptional regulator [Yinghuangia soli]MCF2529111.1 TetR/AcrR family transcriptional regulator [Yinghuangia soli]